MRVKELRKQLKYAQKRHGNLEVRWGMATEGDSIEVVDVAYLQDRPNPVVFLW